MLRRAFTSSFRGISLLSRLWNGPSGVLAGKQAEQKMISILKNRFPNAHLIEVTDMSGGCGAMFDINVVAPEFKGLNTVKQHRIINEVLKEEIKDMHVLHQRLNVNTFTSHSQFFTIRTPICYQLMQESIKCVNILAGVMSTIYPEEIHQFSNEKFMEQEKPQNTWLFRCKKLRLRMSVVSVVY
ncbi:hypothetical protein HN011_001676 [Eciton burchellii]|nr:hypothetical protein HN011_001676 [Eciton burchellii]